MHIMRDVPFIRQAYHSYAAEGVQHMEHLSTSLCYIPYIFIHCVALLDALTPDNQNKTCSFGASKLTIFSTASL